MSCCALAPVERSVTSTDEHLWPQLNASSTSPKRAQPLTTAMKIRVSEAALMTDVVSQCLIYATPTAGNFLGLRQS